jgi:aspartate racemase
VLCLDSEWSQIEGQPSHNPAPSADPENLAYVIYTSGSTGRPKGVAVTQRNIVRLVQQTNYVSIDADDTLLQLSPVTFDASTFEIWGALLNGARLAMYPAGALSLERMGEVLRQYQITTLWLTAGLFHLLVDEEVQALAGVRQLLAGGDVLSPARVEKVLREVSGCRVINGYGPTETTTFACCYAMTKAEQATEPVPIGGPIANSQVHILDPHLRAVPVGIAGELYIAGDGLARGYLDGAAATAEKFVPNPFSQVPGARMYRTGDRARWRSNGLIEFLGRLDAQAKIRGHRIEPGEVEALLMGHPCIQEVAVIVREDEGGEKRLVGYVVTKGDDGATASQLRTYVKERLPEYMVPRRIVILDSIPLTSNGKLDRGLLPDDEDPAKEEPEATARPRGEMEAAIATVWQQVLHVDTMSLDDNFFDLGGHSLLILQVRRELREVLGRNIPIVDFFTYPSIRALVQHLDLGPQGPAAIQASRDDAGLRNDYLSRRKASSIRRQNHD